MKGDASMNDTIDKLAGQNRLLFEIPLKPVQGQRFQPTGFPSLGSATYQTKEGLNLLVESAQSMANRMELVCWDEPKQKPVTVLDGISYVRVEREEKGKGRFYLTSSLTEAHRLNSPYILESSDKSFSAELQKALGGAAVGPINRKLLAETLLKYDASTLLHGIFLAKKELAGGRLRVARALSAFIEASGVRQAVSGGVKNDHVNPSGDTAKGFGNVPFSREEFTAEKIALYVNLDLGQIRGYGLEEDATTLLILLALYKTRALLNGNLRLRTACDLVVDAEVVTAQTPRGFVLPALADIEAALKETIKKCKTKMTVTTVLFNDEMKKSKAGDDEPSGSETEGETPTAE